MLLVACTINSSKGFTFIFVVSAWPVKIMKNWLVTGTPQKWSNGSDGLATSGFSSAWPSGTKKFNSAITKDEMQDPSVEPSLNSWQAWKDCPLNKSGELKYFKMHCRAGEYGDYQQSAMYVPVSGLYYPPQDVQVCTVISLLQIFKPVLFIQYFELLRSYSHEWCKICNTWGGLENS